MADQHPRDPKKPARRRENPFRALSSRIDPSRAYGKEIDRIFRPSSLGEEESGCEIRTAFSSARTQKNAKALGHIGFHPSQRLGSV